LTNTFFERLTLTAHLRAPLPRAKVVQLGLHLGNPLELNLKKRGLLATLLLDLINSAQQFRDTSDRE
jgi:hypothetical protein